MQVGNATEIRGLATATTGELELYGFDMLDPDTTGLQCGHPDHRLLLPGQRAGCRERWRPPFRSARHRAGQRFGETVQVALGPDFTDVRYPQGQWYP